MLETSNNVINIQYIRPVVEILSQPGRYSLSHHYRAMHFSAKRGIAIACRLSVCLSVTLVDCDHIGWNTSEIISPLVSLGCLLSADSNIMGLFQGEHPEIWAQSDPPPVDLSVGDIR